MFDIQKARSILKEYTVKIRISSSEFGTGFFIGVGVIMTCLHVIDNCSNNSVIIWKEKKYKILKTTKPYNENCDIALIYSDINNAEYLLLGLDATKGIRIHQQLFSYAFCKDYEYSIPVEMIFEGKDDFYYTVKDGQIMPGMSGAAVLDESTGLICGIIKKTRDENLNLGGRIVPITEENIKTINLSFSKIYSDFKNTSWYTNLEQWQINNFLNYWDRFKNHDDLKDELIYNIVLYKDSIFSNFISGSKRIRIKNLFSNELILPFSGYDKYYNEIPRLKEHILNIIHDANEKGVIICSDPGLGKTTLNYDIFNSLLEDCVNSRNDCILPIFIDLSAYEMDNECDFGTFEWLKKYLLTNYKITEGHFKLIMSLEKRVVFIFDSIDEYLSRFTISKINEFFSREFFNSFKIVLSCRKYNYEGYLCSVKIVNNLEYSEISGLNTEKIKRYLNSYLKFLNKGRKQKKSLQNLIIKTSNINNLSHNPLHLNMIIDLVSRNKKTIYRINGIKSLYENYVKEWLNLEDSKYHNKDKCLTYDDKLILLEKISISFFEEYQIGREEEISFTLDALDSLLEKISLKYDIKATLNQIINSTFLIQYRLDNRTKLRFIHKSFQEFFIASYIFHAMEKNPKQLSEIMREYFSAYISEFLREFMQECKSDLALTRKIAKNCMEAYNINAIPGDEELIYRKKIAREQLAYYMGNLCIKESDDFLVALIDRETDIWVKRGILFGLSFGENSEYNYTYLSILKNERNAGVSTAENDCNIGFTLSFFGDQPFDIFYPEKNNLDYTDCTKTINRILYLLGTESDYSGWRLNLYIIIDLYKYREVSRDNVRDNLKKTHL